MACWEIDCLGAQPGDSHAEHNIPSSDLQLIMPDMGAVVILQRSCSTHCSVLGFIGKIYNKMIKKRKGSILLLVCARQGYFADQLLTVLKFVFAVWSNI